MEEKVYTLFWIGENRTDLVFGYNIVDAFEKGGYDNSDINALDFYLEGDRRVDYVYDPDQKKWVG